MPALAVVGLDHVVQQADDPAAVLAYYVDKLTASVTPEPDDPTTGARSVSLGAVTLQIADAGAGSPADAKGAWGSIGWQVEGSPDESTVAKHGLVVTLQTGPTGSGPTATPAANANPLCLVGTPTVSVRCREPEDAAAWLADLVGADTYRDERRHLNTLAVGTRFADHCVEFVASLTGSDHDLIGAALVERGEGIDHVRLATSDFFAARRELVRNAVKFTQMGNISLLLEAEHTGGAVIELYAE